MSNVTFDYGIVKIDQLHATLLDGKNGARRVSSIAVGDKEAAVPSKRFWSSLAARFNFSKSIFKYFSPAEVFERISKQAKNNEIRYCVETREEGEGKHRKTLLAVTNPSNPVIKYDELQEMVSRYGTDGISYSEGVVTTKHRPRVGCTPFPVGPDLFENRFVIDTPVDGFGRPSVYLSMLRMVCSNGAVGYARAFRSEINIGNKTDDIRHNFTRALNSFNNEEGYGVLRQRFESAQQSWASLRETNRVYQILEKLAAHNELTLTSKEMVRAGAHGADFVEVVTHQPVFRRFRELTGDMHHQYGVANLDALSAKKQRALPCNCTVFDLLNFTSEMATHHATEYGAKKIQAVIGDLLGDSGGFDLEGTKTKVADFKDFFLANDSPAAIAKRLVENGYLKGGDKLLAS